MSNMGTPYKLPTHKVGATKNRSRMYGYRDDQGNYVRYTTHTLLHIHIWIHQGLINTSETHLHQYYQNEELKQACNSTNNPRDYLTDYMLQVTISIIKLKGKGTLQ